MPRGNRVYRKGSSIVVVIDRIEHTLTETAFIELMEDAQRVLQRLAEKMK